MNEFQAPNNVEKYILAMEISVLYNPEGEEFPIRVAQRDDGSIYASRTERRAYLDTTVAYLDDSLYDSFLGFCQAVSIIIKNI